MALAVVVIGIIAWEPLYWWAMTEVRYHEFSKGIDGDEHIVRGYYRVSRWDIVAASGRQAEHGPAEYWYPSGFVATAVLRDSQRLIRKTVWDSDGKVIMQSTPPTARLYPPWRWGITDQSEPTMPEWMKDDSRWQAALDAQRADPRGPTSTGVGAPRSEPGAPRGPVGATPVQDRRLADALNRRFDGRGRFESGFLRLKYFDGRRFQEDVEVLEGFENVRFGAEAGDQGSVDFLDEFVFSGWSEGALFLDISFAEAVNVKFRLEVEDLGDDPEFSIVVMADRNGNCITSSFGTNVIQLQRGEILAKVEPDNRRLRLSPSQWIAPGFNGSLRLKYRESRTEGAVSIGAWHDGRLTCRTQSEVPLKGRVGFRWRDVSFRVTALRVTGRLDPEWLAQNVR